MGDPNIQQPRFNSKLVDPIRVHILKETTDFKGDSVCYNMFCEQRSFDNYALMYTAELGNQLNLPYSCIHVIQKQIKNRTFARQYYFSLKGLIESSAEIRKQGFMFFETEGDIVSDVVKMVKDTNAAVLVFDFLPIVEVCQWQQKITKKVPYSVYAIECQTLPIRLVTKRPYSTPSVRSIALKNLSKYLIQFPKKTPKFPKWDLKYRQDNFDYESAIKKIINNKKMMEVPPIKRYPPGSSAAIKIIDNFFNSKERFGKFHLRNDYGHPEYSSQINCYLKFGQISEQLILKKLQKHKTPKKSYDMFLDECLVRRYLAYCMCYYNPQYRKIEGLPQWVKVQLQIHQNDKKEHIYTYQQLKNGKTHDQFWNEMAIYLKNLSVLPSYLRMQWMKSIIMWTKNYQQALDVGYKLNNSLTLDGLTPAECNVSWCLGLMDIPSPQKTLILGSIRSMSLQRTQKLKGDYNRFKQIMEQQIQEQKDWEQQLIKKYKN